MIAEYEMPGCFGEKESAKIKLLESLHNEIQEFFLTTSLPRIRKEKEAHKEKSPAGYKR